MKKAKIFYSFTECDKEVQRLKLLQKHHPLCPEVIPLELTDLDQWIVWSYEVRRWENGTFGVAKVPYQAKIPNRKASRTISLDWCDLETAVRCAKNNWYSVDGIGFVFSREDGLSGVDFDNCRNPVTGHIREEYQFWIDILGGYAEVSPSGTGVKVWVKGTISDKYFKTEKSTGFRILNFAGGEIEVYRRGQYFTVTTQCLKDVEFIATVQRELDVLSEWSLSRVSRDLSYNWSSVLLPTDEDVESESSFHVPMGEDVERELSLLQKYWDEMNYGYIDESYLQVRPIIQPETVPLTHPEPQPITDRFYIDGGPSRCGRCGKKCDPAYELCFYCYNAGEPEEKVEDAVCDYFSTFQGFFVVPQHPIRIGVYTPRPDVVLLDGESNRVVIVECKREGIMDHGIEQLKSYLTASDVQFGIFANSTDPDEWIFFENLRRYRFKENIPRVQFEAEIIADRSIESIREEKDRLVREAEQVENEIATNKQKHIDLKQQRMLLLEEISFLGRDKDRLEKNRNKIKSEREALKKEKESWQRGIEKHKLSRAYLEKINADLDGEIRYKTPLIRELESKLDELQAAFDEESIYGQIREELERLGELDSEIKSKQQLARQDQKRRDAYEQKAVEINQKIQQLIQTSQERESILKQLRVVVNQLKTANSEQTSQIEENRRQLLQDLRKQKSHAQLTEEIEKYKKEKSALEEEIMQEMQQLPFEEREVRPAYVQIQSEIDKLKTEKSKIEAKIGHQIFLRLP